MPDIHPTLAAWRDAAFGRNQTVASPIARLALLGNFPPRRCGIATFTGDVHNALTAAYPSLACDVYAMTDEGASYDYPAAVSFELHQDQPADYLEAARRINSSGAQAVCIQHEYGIYGGSAGEHLLILLNALTVPVVTTLHTILIHPDPDQHRVMKRLVEKSERIVVMSRRGRDILRDVYAAPAAKIAVVPHGVPDHPLVETAPFKARFDLSGHEVLFSFGLLSPGKGLEQMIEAMPAIVAQRPKALYLILGATHPHLVARQGEAYRERLIAQAQNLGVGEHVRFVNTYVDTPLLLEYLAAADIYVTPYLNEAQITSGTLSYAVGLGKPVISTPYWHAAELLADDRGLLTPFNDPAALAAAAISLLGDDAKRERIRRNAYAAGREMIWSKLAEGYMALFAAVRKTGATAPTPMKASPRAILMQPRLDAIEAMTDSCGLIQHSVFSVPDRNHGYCVDDNARGLILMMRLAQGGSAIKTIDALSTIYAAFLQHAWNPDLRRFRNFMAYDRSWLEEAGSDDSFGRTFWALGETAARSTRDDLKIWANALALRAMPELPSFTAPRTLAFLSLGLVCLMEAHPDDRDMRNLLQKLADRLVSQLHCERKPAWCWFESGLSYDNARLAEALLRAGAALGDGHLVQAGLDALEWLCDVQTAPTGVFRPVGSESFDRGAYRLPQQFDQQPLEATATIDACEAAFRASGQSAWLDRARCAFAWFLGENDLGAPMAQASDGGCYDGLTRNGPNLNRGAESLLSFQLAVVRMANLPQRGQEVTSIAAGG